MNALNAARVTAIASRIRLRAGVDHAFARWQAEFTRVVATAPGFVSIEIVPAYAGALDWQIVQRFASPEALLLWTDSKPRAAQFEALARMRDPHAAASPDEAAPDYHSDASVTEVVATRVEPGREHEFRVWAESIQAAQGCYPGYMGTLVQAPLSDEIPYWTTLVRFSTPDKLDDWLGSNERKAMLARAEPIVTGWSSRRVQGSFWGWFGASAEPPPAWKQTALVLLVLFPVVMLEIRFLSPHLSGLTPALATFIGNAISVSLVSWPLMRIAIAGLGWWLHPPQERRRQVEWLGLATLLALYAAELALFTWLF